MTTITLPRATVERALEALETGGWNMTTRAITALRAALAQQAEPAQEPVAWGWAGDPSTQDYASTQPEPDAYGYASRLAVAIWEKHYKDIAPQWKPLDDLMGVLTQIDNMTSGLTLLAQQAEPVEPVATLIAQRDALLEALKYLDKEFRQHGRQHWPEAVRVRAAIKSVEEGK